MTHYALASFAVLAIANCDPAQFKNPVSDPARAKVDPRLTGTWAGRDESTEFVLFIQPVAGQLDLTLVGRGGADGVAHLSWKGFATTVGGKTYLNLQEKQFSDNFANKYELKPGYMLVRYELSGDKLSLDYLANDALESLGGEKITSAESPVVVSTIEKLPPKSFSHFLVFKRFKVP